jgi:hypothetical protein
MHIQQRRLNLSVILFLSTLLLLTACSTIQVDVEPMPLQADQPPPELIQDEPTEIPAEEVPSMASHMSEDVQQYHQTPGTTVDPLLEFEARLMQAVETHDFDLMQSLMGDPFGLAGWGSESWAYTPDKAIEQFRVNYLGADNTIRFQDAPDLSHQLNDRDILSVWNPAVNPVSALFSAGWGSDGKAEAFLIIAQRPDGTFYWEGILMALSGFEESGVTQPVPEPSVTLSPLSGPSGTMVQVIASGFSSNMPVTVWVGPANSEFSEAARGTTDADGAFAIKVPTQGAPGMNLVFAVGVEGQPGISSPDQFHITGAIGTGTVLETDVKYVMVFPDVAPMYSGPGDTYPQIGGIFGGMAGTVTGVSVDGQWWRVMCPDDTVGSCWISADPNVTEPTTPVGF